MSQYRLLLSISLCSLCIAACNESAEPGAPLGERGSRDASGGAERCSMDARERFAEAVTLAFDDDRDALAEAETVLEHGTAVLTQVFEDRFFLVELCQAADVDFDCGDSDAVAAWATDCRAAVGPFAFWNLSASGASPGTDVDLAVESARGMFLRLPGTLFEDEAGGLSVSFGDSGVLVLDYEPDDDNGSSADGQYPAEEGRLLLPPGKYRVSLSSHDNSEFFIDASFEFDVVE